MENSRELLLLAETVAKEKDINKEDVLSFITDGIETALKKNFPEGTILQVEINNDNGKLEAWRIYELVNQIENVEGQMLFSEVEDETVSDGYVWEPIDFSLTRQQFNIVKQITLQKIKQESKEQQILTLLDKPINIYTGTIKIVKKDNIIIDLAGLDIIMSKKDTLPKDRIVPGAKITFTLIEDPTKKQYVGTRTNEKFLIELLKQEVRQIEDGEIEIVACARNPGMRSKVIVKSKNSQINPVRICIGNKGMHIKNILEDLNGEFIDIIEFEKDPAKMLINSISPVNVTNIIVDEDKKNMEIAVDSSQISQAIGKGGKNIEMISSLIGWKIEIYSIEDWDTKQENILACQIEHFKASLNCDDELAEFLIESGINSIDEIAYLSINDLNLDLDDDTIHALKENSKETIANPSKNKQAQAFLILPELNFNKDETIKLIENNILNIDDVADLSTYDLQDIFPDIDIDRAKNIIMKARHKKEEVNAN